jgi:hypothetical protein
MLKWEATHKLLKAPTNSSAGHGLGTMPFSSIGLLGNCFWRKGFEAAFGPDRMGEKGGYFQIEEFVKR